MTLRIGDALGDGLRRGLSYSGAVLMALTAAYQLVFLASINTVFREFLPPEALESGQFALALPIPPAAAGVLSAIGLLFALVLYLVTARALTRDMESLESLPSELFTRRIGRAALSAVGANIVVSVLVLIGFLLLVVPGVFLAVSFAFVVFPVAVEDERALDALRRSWALTSGNRWSVFALLLVIGVVTGGLSAISSVVSIVSPLAGQIVNVAITAVLSILGFGILAEAYLQLRDEHDQVAAETAETTAL